MEFTDKDKAVRNILGSFEEETSDQRFAIAPFDDGTYDIVHMFSGTPMGRVKLQAEETLESVAEELSKRLDGATVRAPTNWSKS